MVSGTDRKYAMGERIAFHEDDLSMDIRQVHRRESEGAAKERKKPGAEGNKRKIQLREDDTKAGQKRVQAVGIWTLGS